MTYDFIPYYEEAGISCTVSPILDDAYVKHALIKSDQTYRMGLAKYAQYLLRQVLARLNHTLRARSYSVIVLEKDLVPYLPYSLEAMLFALNRPVIVHYDEATYDFYRSHPRRLIRCAAQGKIERIIRRAAHVVAWNPEVASYALKLNPNVTTVTTGIDLRRYTPKSISRDSQEPVRIGWIGTPSGFAYLHELDPVFRRLSQSYPIELYVVSSQDFQLPGVSVINRRWSVQTEVNDLHAMDIGIMPLPQTEWAAAKSGCKMLQYMGAGLPVVVSPVGINAQIVDNETNGFLAVSKDDWYRQIAALIEDIALRREFGEAGRIYVENNNSQQVIAGKLIAVMKRVARSLSS